MTLPRDWIEHHRADRELLGWMREEPDGYVVFDLLGRPITEPVDWATAEQALETLGIGYLAEAYELLVDGRWIPVQLTEVSTEGIRAKSGYSKAIDAPTVEYLEQFPATASLRRAATRSRDQRH